MSATWKRTAALASVVVGALLASPMRATAECTHEEVESGGIWIYLKDAYQGGDFLSITLVNMTDYMLYNSGNLIAHHWTYNFQDPFAGRPVEVMDVDSDEVKEQGVPPYSSVTWKSSEASSPTPQHYEGDLVLELRGYTDAAGRVLAGPTWPHKFHLRFTPQDAIGWIRDFTDNMAGQGTWVALRPEVVADWDPPNRFRSGAWTTPLSPANPDSPVPGEEFATRNIVTIANKWLVVTLFTTQSWNVIQPLYHEDLNHNLIIAVRQTNWVGPEVPSDTNPVAGMDAYTTPVLDWKDAWSHSLPHNDTPRSCNWPFP